MAKVDPLSTAIVSGKFDRGARVDGAPLAVLARLPPRWVAEHTGIETTAVLVSERGAVDQRR